MTRLKPLLWLSAWSLWACLGFGLHRELPRDLVVVHETLAGNGSYRGFVGDSNFFVLLTAANQDAPVFVNVFDAETGKLVRRTEAPSQDWVWCSSEDAVRHGALFVNRRSDATAGVAFHALDILTGEWRLLTTGRGTDASVHPRHPWVVFTEIPKNRDGPHRVVAMDFKTGREIFARNLPPDAPIYRNPYFLNDDRILVQLTEGTLVPQFPRKGEKSSVPLDKVDPSFLKNRLEVWRVADPPVLEYTIDGVCLRIVTSVAANGRVAYADAPMEPAQGVFDVAAGRTVFTHPLQDPEFDGRYHQNGGGGPRLSPSGRAVFGGRPRTLRDVDSGRLLWGPPSPDFFATIAAAGHFQVLESWHTFWKDWFPNRAFMTRALRSMETGELLYRSTWGDTWIAPHLFNADGTLGVANGGRVYRMPAHVNWPLLAFCQTLLALPLILLWTTLRWRRCRLAARPLPTEAAP